MHATVAGKRRAEKPARHAGSRGTLFRTLPPPPVLLGVAALAISTGGAITVHAHGDGQPTSFSRTSATSAAADFIAAQADRRVVSRSSARDATDTTTDTDLVRRAEAALPQRDAALAKFAQQAQRRAAWLRENQWVLPVTDYRLTARFGDYSGLWSTFHTGLDFAAPTGTPIHAIANGVVTSVGYDGSYGNKTVITLDDGTELWFCHQSSYAVSEGQHVQAGQLIGYIGSTGNTTGPHLHLEVRPGGGDPVDPYPVLVQHGLQP